MLASRMHNRLEVALMVVVPGPVAVSMLLQLLYGTSLDGFKAVQQESGAGSHNDARPKHYEQCQPHKVYFINILVL